MKYSYQSQNVLQTASGALALYRKMPILFSGIATIVVVCYDLLALVVANRGPFGQGSYAVFTGATAAQTLISAPLIAAVISCIIPDDTGMEGALVRHGPGFWLRTVPKVIVAQIVVYLGVAFASIFLIVPGIILGLRWCVVSPVVAAEQSRIPSAFGRSRNLTVGYYWHIFGVTLLVEGIAVVAALGVQAVTGGANTVGAVTLEFVAQTVVACYVALNLTVLYRDLRERQADAVASVVTVTAA